MPDAERAGPGDKAEDPEGSIENLNKQIVELDKLIFDPDVDLAIIPLGGRVGQTNATAEGEAHGGTSANSCPGRLSWMASSIVGPWEQAEPRAKKNESVTASKLGAPRRKLADSGRQRKTNQFHNLMEMKTRAPRER